MAPFLIVQDSQSYNTTGNTNALGPTIRHFVVNVMYSSSRTLFCHAIVVLPNAYRLRMSPLGLHESSLESSLLTTTKTGSRTISTLSPSNTNSLLSLLYAYRPLHHLSLSGLNRVRPGHSSPLHLLPALAVLLYFLLIGWCYRHISQIVDLYSSIIISLLLPHMHVLSSPLYNFCILFSPAFLYYTF